MKEVGICYIATMASTNNRELAGVSANNAAYHRGSAGTSVVL